MFYKEMCTRTKAFSISVVRFCNKLKGDDGLRHIRLQLFRCGTSVGANYRATVHAQSKAAFVAKLSIVIEEADEVCYWIAMLIETYSINNNQLQIAEDIKREAIELRNLFTASRKTINQRKLKK